MTDENEFLAGAGKDGPATVEDMSKWASRLLADPKNREAIEKQFRDGKLSVAMFTWLKDEAHRIDAAERAKKQAPMRSFVQECTEFELQIFANVGRRLEGREEGRIRIPGTIVSVTMAEMLATLAEVYKP